MFKYVNGIQSDNIVREKVFKHRIIFRKNCPYQHRTKWKQRSITVMIKFQNVSYNTHNVHIKIVHN